MSGFYFRHSPLTIVPVYDPRATLYVHDPLALRTCTRHGAEVGDGEAWVIAAAPRSEKK